MNFALIGGTHGNEPIGVKVLEFLDSQVSSEPMLKFSNSFKTFLGNPEALKLKKRYVDSDLNRAFGPKGQSQGFEKIRSYQLTEAIKNKFDFVVDLHTTTSNMGLTLILTRLDEKSLNAACFLKSSFPDLKLIVSMRAGDDCPYTSFLAPSALIVEVGPVANNVIKTSLVKETFKLVTALLDYDFSQKYASEDFECFKILGIKSYPEDGNWMIHENVDGNDFSPLKPGDPIFTNIKDEIIPLEGNQTIYPIFINEAAYLENNTALEFGLKMKLSEALK